MVTHTFAITRMSTPEDDDMSQAPRQLQPPASPSKLTTQDDIHRISAQLEELRFRFGSLHRSHEFRQSELQKILNLLCDRCQRYLKAKEPLHAWMDAISYQKLAPSNPIALLLLGSAYEARVLYRSALIAFKTSLRLLEKDSSIDPAELKRHTTYNLVRGHLNKLILRIKKPDLWEHRSNNNPLFSPPSVLDHHRSGCAISTLLSVYWDCLREQSSSVDEARFGRLELRELQRHLTISASPALLLTSVGERPGKLYFPRIILEKSSWHRLPPEEGVQEPCWQRKFIEKHLYKFDMQNSVSAEEKAEKVSLLDSARSLPGENVYYLINHFVLDVVECDEGGLLCNSDPIVFRAGEGDGFKVRLWSRRVVLPSPAAFDRSGSSFSTSSLPTSASSCLSEPIAASTKQSHADLNTCLVVGAGPHPQSPSIAHLPFSQWVDDVAFRVDTAGRVVEAVESESLSYSLSGSDDGGADDGNLQQLSPRAKVSPLKLESVTLEPAALDFATNIPPLLNSERLIIRCSHDRSRIQLSIADSCESEVLSVVATSLIVYEPAHQWWTALCEGSLIIIVRSESGDHIGEVIQFIQLVWVNAGGQIKRVDEDASVPDGQVLIQNHQKCPAAVRALKHIFLQADATQLLNQLALIPDELTIVLLPLLTLLARKNPHYFNVMVKDVFNSNHNREDVEHFQQILHRVLDKVDATRNTSVVQINSGHGTLSGSFGNDMHHGVHINGNVRGANYGDKNVGGTYQSVQIPNGVNDSAKVNTEPSSPAHSSSAGTPAQSQLNSPLSPAEIRPWEQMPFKLPPGNVASQTKVLT